MQFTLERVSLHDRRVLRVRGDLDMSTATDLTDAVRAELKASESPEGGTGGHPPVAHVVIDLGVTEFLDSSGARALVWAARDAREAGVELSVACPPANGPVRRVLDLLQLQAVVPISDMAPVDLGPRP